jgi:formylglycine-generating enzyme required for sulfatase activity
MWSVLATAQQYTIFEINGKKLGSFNEILNKQTLDKFTKEHHGAILVKKNSSNKTESFKVLNNFQINLAQVGENQRDINLSNESLDEKNWIEVEKNEIVKICLDRQVHVWETSLNAVITNDSCLVFQAPIFIGTEAIQLHTYPQNDTKKINIATGMKFLNFKKDEIMLGYNKHNIRKKKLNTDIEEDPERLVSITATYLVDKYPVTNCEFVQLLWDSIPATSSYKNPGYKKMHHENWFSIKKASIRNENCPVHDTVAKSVSLYQAMKYANARSLREGLKPYYIFSATDSLDEAILSNGRYIIGRWDFSFHHDAPYIMVTTEKESDGYRLPYYDEWMMFARGGDKKMKAPWGNAATPLNEIQKYARFNSTYAFDGTDDYISEPVGQLLPNGYGLYDMFGLAAEHVLLDRIIFEGNLGYPSLLKGGSFVYGFYDTGATGVGAAFRLIRNIGNNAKWTEVKSN